MQFCTLKERMQYFKSLTDYKLTPNSYVICHVDGKNFSKKIKKLFTLPFDDKFMGMMNDSAIYACKNIQGCKLAYVQSDEISFILTDFEDFGTDSYYGFRLCKLQSIIASLVTSKFQQLFIEMCVKYNLFENDVFSDKYLFQFDCKCFNVPSYNDAFAWLKFRQNDCIRNSKQQAAQTYCTYKELLRKNTDQQIEFLKTKNGIDWNEEYSDGQKYGRLIYNELDIHTNDSGEDYVRHVWRKHDCQILTSEYFSNLNILPVKN